MSFSVYDKHIRISKINLERLKSLAKKNNTSISKQLDKILNEMLEILINNEI